MSDLLYWEDFETGQVLEYGPIEVSTDDILAFAKEYDPQPFHLDDAFARTTVLGGLCASGWHTCGLWMRMFVDDWASRTASLGSPGIDEIRWRVPVRPGDVLRGRSRIAERRASRSRADLGFNVMDHEMFNGRHQTVMTMRSTQMLRRRPSTEVVG